MQNDEEREKGWLAVLLAWVAGLVDAVGYLTLYQLFTAQMSGNSVRVGFSLGQAQWSTAAQIFTPIPLFVLGVALGALLIEAAMRRGVRSTFALLMALEGLMLAGYLVYGSTHLYGGTIETNLPWQFVVLAGLLAVPMGLQTAALQRVAGRIVHTTYITGMLTNLATEAVTYLFWLRDRSHDPESASQGVLPKHPSRDRALLLGGIWLAYVCGAAVGGYTELRWDLNALILPLGMLAVIIALDLAHPIYAPSSGREEC